MAHGVRPVRHEDGERIQFACGVPLLSRRILTLPIEALGQRELPRTAPATGGHHQFFEAKILSASPLKCMHGIHLR
jgi:hypothetical protein